MRRRIALGLAALLGVLTVAFGASPASAVPTETITIWGATNFVLTGGVADVPIPPVEARCVLLPFATFSAANNSFDPLNLGADVNLYANGTVGGACTDKVTNQSGDTAHPTLKNRADSSATVGLDKHSNTVVGTAPARFMQRA